LKAAYWLRLKTANPTRFSEIQSQITFSHSTLQQHLTKLVKKGLVLKEKHPEKGFGRPKYAYCVPAKTTKQVAGVQDDPNAELVAMPFSRVWHICRFEKGGWCKEKKAQCSPQICPQIRK
jgi:predicted ArsR family transcriptional regulator